MEYEDKKDLRFGTIAIKLGFVTSENLDRAIIIQKRIMKEANVHRHVGEILLKMGVINQNQRDEILVHQIKEKKLRNKTFSEKPLLAPSTDENSISDAQLTQSEDSNFSESKNCQSSVDNSTCSGKDEREDVHSCLTVKILKDKMKAVLSIASDCTKTLSVADVKQVLERQKIQYGIIEDRKIEAYLMMEPALRKTITIAVGIFPKPPDPDKVVYYFDTDPLKIGTELTDGSIDWKNRGVLPQTKEGELLAEIIQGEKGTPGRNVLGRFVPPPKKERVVLRRGKGVDGSEDGMKVIAKVGGMPKISPDGRIHVLPTLNIKGDVGVETGHVTFEGHIEVSGIVQKGYDVKGQTLRALEFYESNYIFSGDMLALRGVFGATVLCDGNFKGGHIHYSNIQVLGNLVSQKEIFESSIETSGEVIIDTGVIISSTIRAKKGVKAKDIGTLASKPCQIDVGINYRIRRMLEEKKIKISELNQKSEDLKHSIDEKKGKSDDLNIQLGIMAQEQDALMIENRQMEEKLKIGEKTDDEASIAAIQNNLSELSKKLSKMDDLVMNYFQEDAKLNEEISNNEKEKTEISEAIEMLKNEIEQLESELELDEAVPVVRVSGKITSGTIIKGPHCTFKVPEDLHRVKIAEIQNTETPHAYYEFKVYTL